jgi:hypothetical protein
MTNNINIPIADILPSDDKTPWHPARKTIKRDEPPFPADKDIELWLKHNSPLTFEHVSDNARRYLLWKLRLLGRKKNWISALPRTRNPRRKEAI